MALDEWNFKPLRAICSMDLLDNNTFGNYIYSDEVPPEKLYRIIKYEGYTCDCCCGGEDHILGEYNTLSEAIRNYIDYEARIEFWSPIPYGETGHWKKYNFAVG